jgi:hypothetical protein
VDALHEPEELVRRQELDVLAFDLELASNPGPRRRIGIAVDRPRHLPTFGVDPEVFARAARSLDRTGGTVAKRLVVVCDAAAPASPTTHKKTASGASSSDFRAMHLIDFLRPCRF